MAIIANTFLTYSAVGNREDLTDRIYNISPEETPFMSMAKRGKASGVLHEWQTDALGAASSSNAVVEGNDPTYAAATPTSRKGNYCQISEKTYIVSGTQEVVSKAGRKSEVAYQKALRAAELKLDMESALLANKPSVAGASGTAREHGGMGAFVASNTSVGTGGTEPTGTTLPNDARGDGTQRAFTEPLLKDVIQQCWVAGARPSVLMLGAFNKQAFSAFEGNATKTYNMDKAVQAKTVAAADVYVSDFGTLKVIPNRLQRSRDAWVLDPRFLEIPYLRPFHTQDAPKTGDAIKGILRVEYTLKVGNEAAHGLVADLTTS